MRDTQQAYSAYMNRRLAQSGHLWQGRFYSTVLDESHLWAAVAYVERNPVRAGMVQRAEEYPWSSAAAHCGRRRDPVLAEDWPPAGVVPDRSAWLSQEQPADQVQAIRRRTLTGRPCGGDSLLERLERLLARPLKPRKPGRPKKTKAAE
jgi:putative transposase